MKPKVFPESTNGFHPANLADVLCAPRVIGLYGIPGAGKTFLLDQLKEELGQELFEYYEGSDVIQSMVPGGLDAFHELAEVTKTHFRQRAIDSIKYKCAQSGKTGIVTGHFMFWSEGAEAGMRVYTQNDLNTYTHVLYINTPPEVMAQRCMRDSKKDRLSLSLQHLRRWQEAEIEELRGLCRHHNILFSTVYPNLIDKLSELILDFQRHSEDYNLSIAEQYLDEAISPEYDKLETVLFMDADKTLTAKDTGALFWGKLTQPEDEDNPLRALFSSQLGYSYTAFRQAMLIYEETTNDSEFNVLCEDVALQTAVYPEFVTLLRLVGRYSHICPVIVTCGLRCIWEKIMIKEGLSTTVKILGGGRIADKFVVTPSVKRAMATRVQSIHEAYTWAFGDSPLDLPMMAVANEAIVVVGEEQFRSKSMDRELLAAIDKDGLRARQALLPSNCPLRLDTAKLPVVDLTGDGLVKLVVQHRNPPGGLQIVHATCSNAARLLTTPMRDAAISGPDLRDAHFETGAFLARKYVSELIGLEELTMCHVQAYNTTGHRLLGEKRTLIVALMRGGGPMALGVSKVFKEAMFLHASQPDDVKRHHLKGIVTVILVDSVINNGDTIVKFVQSIRRLHAAICIVVVAGVVQDQAVSGCSPIRALARSSQLTIVALRVSANKYTGRGNTDTGNRLFNTPHLP
ncbi:uracil phosphoribosyltransferase-domain-containing protein [Aspergillus cavernicola]|uniref:Uracil phosphoribosyltransferase-domain-containing protein n=1 Tax=Aspergillus cavernicola TaxID=176166 RepID=A0ABR4HSB3_9EURO